MADTFGYGPNSMGWLDGKASQLCERLQRMIAMELKENPDDFLHRKPSVHVNEHTGQVKIYNLDQCSLDIQQRIVDQAELIYHEVMELPLPKEQEPEQRL